MAKKDFDAINTKKADTGASKGKVYEAIERGEAAYKQQGTASEQEQEERKAELRTQGRKGCKLPRINLALTPDNHQFVKVMANVTGQSMTQFTNFVVEQYRKEHPDIYEQAKQVISLVNNTGSNENQ